MTTGTPTRCDVAALAEDRIAAWLPVAIDQQIQLDIDTQPATAQLTPGYLDQILDNLLDNALGATPAGGRIQVSVTTAGDGVDVTVADTGPGMTADQRAHAVRRWTSDRAGDGGAGLGLTIVKRLVEADRGVLTLENAPSGGLTVGVHYRLSGE